MAVVAPAVPLTTVLVPNTTGQYVNVTLTGFTSTFVYGYDQAGTQHQLGTSGNMSVCIPPGWSISITFSVAGTWTWTTANVAPGFLPVYAQENQALINQIVQLPFLAHAELAQTGLAVGVSN